ncbi:MAG: hypothetical protein M3Y21_04715 [Candidatus Eremiobacteraeota bacterium]|nr:hypothetical protein [Candidatus Eremiobacteraeota bacterium]
MNGEFSKFGKIFYLPQDEHHPPTAAAAAIAFDFDSRFVAKYGADSASKMIASLVNRVTDAYIAGFQTRVVRISSIWSGVSRTMGVLAVRAVTLGGKNDDLELPGEGYSPYPKFVDLTDVRIILLLSSTKDLSLPLGVVLHVQMPLT